MLFSLWLGMIIAAGESGCTTIKKQDTTTQTLGVETRKAAPVETKSGSSSSSSTVVRGLRNPDYATVPKVPPPGAKIVYSSVTHQPALHRHHVR